MAILNQGCLQKPHTQTRHKNPCYFPHIRITAAAWEPENPHSHKISPVTGKTIVMREGAAKLRKFMAEEELAINNKIRRSG